MGLIDQLGDAWPSISTVLTRLWGTGQTFRWLCGSPQELRLCWDDCGISRLPTKNTIYSFPPRHRLTTVQLHLIVISVQLVQLQTKAECSCSTQHFQEELLTWKMSWCYSFGHHLKKNWKKSCQNKTAKRLITNTSKRIKKSFVFLLLSLFQKIKQLFKMQQKIIIIFRQLKPWNLVLLQHLLHL